MRSRSTFARMHCVSHSDVLNKSVPTNRECMLMSVKHKNMFYHLIQIFLPFKSVFLMLADRSHLNPPPTRQKLHWATQEQQQWMTGYSLCLLDLCMFLLSVTVEITFRGNGSCLLHLFGRGDACAHQAPVLLNDFYLAA